MYCCGNKPKKISIKITDVSSKQGNSYFDIINKEVNEKINYINSIKKNDKILLIKAQQKICQNNINSLIKADKQFDNEMEIFDVIKYNDQIIMKLQAFNITIYDYNQNSQIIQPFTTNGEVWGKKKGQIRYNQIIGPINENILNISQIFVTSNIVDAYATYLMIEDEKKYFNLLQLEERNNYKRTIIFTSDFITDCALNDNPNNDKKWFYLFLKQLENFNALRYQFQIIYSKIIFLVCFSSHWMVLLVDLNQNYIEVFDSLPNQMQRYQIFMKVINSIFTKLLRKEINLKLKLNLSFPKQKDGYSCGYFSCIALKYICESQNNKFVKFIEKYEMKQILRELLIDY